MEVLKVILIVLEVLVLFNLLIIVHELGHFWAARWRGLVADRFAVWFGKPIWKMEYKGVTYCLGWIPAGGYVSLPQMAPMEMVEGKANVDAQSLPQASVKDRIIVAFAGPLFSFLLAIVFAAVVTLVGRPVSETDSTTVIGHVAKDSPAAKAGLRAGDKITAIDGHKVTRFGGIGTDSIKWRIVSSEGGTVRVAVEREGRPMEFVATPAREQSSAWERRSLKKIMISPAQSCIVAEILPHSPAQMAGLKTNDLVRKVNGQPVYSPMNIVEMAETNAAAPLTLEVERDRRVFTCQITPEKPISPPNEPPSLGIGWDYGGRLTIDRPGPVEQIRASVGMMVSTFAALLSSKSDVKAHHLSGPVGILRIYYLLFQSEHGWRLAIWFSVIFNVNLAVLNLLPIPVLDGGHILLSLIEGIRRKPISLKVLQAIQNGCFFLLIGFMLFITFFDVQDVFSRRGSKAEPPAPIQFAPKAELRNP